MYHCRYKNCYCQKDYDKNRIETACQDCGVTAQYYTASSEDNCNCGFEHGESVFPQNPMLAQSYVPIQRMDKTFIPSVGLKMGTIFPELVSPYAPCQSIEEIAFIKAMNTIGEGCNEC